MTAAESTKMRVEVTPRDESARGFDPGGLLVTLIRGSAWGLADQALMSAANFLTMVILARELTTTGFGSFVLAYTALLLANGLQGALIAQPHNVLGQARAGSAYSTYTRSTAAAQLGFATVLGAAALVAALIAALVAPSVAYLLLALSPAAFAWQFQEFVRRVLYTEHRFRAAFATDAISYGGQATGLVVLAATDRLSGPAALLVVAGTSLLGALFGGILIRESLRGRVERAFLRENWAFGKWLGAANVVSWLSGPFYLYLAALLIGAVGAAALKAAQVILGPLNAFELFLQTVLPVRFSAARERDGDSAVRHRLVIAYAASGPVVIGYAVLVAVFAEPILEALYPPAYARYGAVVALFALYYVILHSVVLLTSALASERSTRAIFRGHVAAVVAGLPIGWLLIETSGVRGAVLGMIVSALILTAVLAYAYRRPSVAVAPAP
jgi:O-antigen/teichoic acid export membrane protein